HIAVNDPFNHQLLENLKQFFPQAAISFHLARESNIRNWISEYFTPEEPTLPDDTADEENTSFFISEDIDHILRTWHRKPRLSNWSISFSPEGSRPGPAMFTSSLLPTGCRFAFASTEFFMNTPNRLPACNRPLLHA
ncbi:MAG: hypothetical protein BZ151_12950, partial [Desulfobacca sp. 4484_104]